MYVCVNEQNIVEIAAQSIFSVPGRTVIEIPNQFSEKDIVGKKLAFGARKTTSGLRIALICNWRDRCGIATYTEYLINALRPKVAAIRIFAEDVPCDRSLDEAEGVIRCWKRGESMTPAIQQVLDWQPDLVFVQHEFGIFPKATHFLKMLEMIDPIPYVMTFHSVYEHLDKTVCTAYVRNMIVHSNEAQACLKRLGHSNNVYVIPHGCLVYENMEELWNIFQNDYTVIQFGFGFAYKGVGMAVDAVKILKDTQPKFKDLFYCYLCSESNHTRTIQERYHREVQQKVKELGLEENVVVLRGYLSEEYLSNFLRTAKLAIFPYKNNPNSIVYGASGAIRKAMACGIPIIASDAHLFDDLEGVLPRPSDAASLAVEIDRVFSDGEYRQSLKDKNADYIRTNCWDAIAVRHLAVFEDIIAKADEGVIRLRL